MDLSSFTSVWEYSQQFIYFGVRQRRRCGSAGDKLRQGLQSAKQWPDLVVVAQ